MIQRKNFVAYQVNMHRFVDLEHSSVQRQSIATASKCGKSHLRCALLELLTCHIGKGFIRHGAIGLGEKSQIGSTL